MLKDHAVVSPVVEGSVDPDDAALVLVQVLQPDQVIDLQKHRLEPGEREPNLTPKSSCTHLLLCLLTVELAVLDDFDSDGCRAPDFDAFEHFAEGALPQDGLHLESGGLGREETSGDQAVALRRGHGFHPFSSEESSRACT